MTDHTPSPDARRSYHQLRKLPSPTSRRRLLNSRAQGKGTIIMSPKKLNSVHHSVPRLLQLARVRQRSRQPGARLHDSRRVVCALAERGNIAADCRSALQPRRATEKIFPEAANSSAHRAPRTWTISLPWANVLKKRLLPHAIRRHGPLVRTPERFRTQRRPHARKKSVPG